MPQGKELYLEMQRALTECPFLRDVSLPANETELVYCELVGELVQYLPAVRSMLVIERNRFSVEVVREVYEILIVEWLQQAADKAADLARVPKARG